MNYLRTSWKRWFTWLLVAILFAIACVFLSKWQFARRAEVVAKNALISTNYPKPPVPIETLASVSGFDSNLEWRPVQLSGHYVQGSGQLVRNKPYGGNQGFLQVAFFQTADLKMYLVDRGWLPTGSSNNVPDNVPNLPSGDLNIVARLRSAEPTNGKSASDGLLPSVTPSLAAGQSGIKEPIAQGYYLRLASETPPSAKAPMLEAMPELSEGNHLSYAIQWIIFAVLAFVTLGYFVKQEREHFLAATDPNYVPKPKRSRRSELDESAEDLATDNQVREG